MTLDILLPIDIQVLSSHDLPIAEIDIRQFYILHILNTEWNFCHGIRHGIILLKPEMMTHSEEIIVAVVLSVIGHCILAMHPASY